MGGSGGFQQIVKEGHHFDTAFKLYFPFESPFFASGLLLTISTSSQGILTML